MPAGRKLFDNDLSDVVLGNKKLVRRYVVQPAGILRVTPGLGEAFRGDLPGLLFEPPQRTLSAPGRPRGPFQCPLPLPPLSQRAPEPRPTRP